VVGLQEGFAPSLRSPAVAACLWLSILRTVPARIAAAVRFLQPIVGVGVPAVMIGGQGRWRTMKR
jgi:drug/metabolite transporter (DMT)-like permease